MFNRLNQSDRRILNFPAVHPCRDISPATLISSLINLSSTISSFKSKSFATNRKHAILVIRQIGILQSVLEEIRYNRLNLSKSEIVSLSELHLTFQKLIFLLEDCSRDGAKLWILMKSELVLTWFRVMTRSISTALDVLPLESLDFSSECKELIGLVMRQTAKSAFEIQLEDKRVVNDVYFVLNQFEKGLFPDRSDLIRVLDYLGIRSWSDCNKEIKFLEAEIVLESLNEGKNESAALSSLLGLMSYCRSVMFDAVNSEDVGQTGGGNGDGGGAMFSCLNSDDFLCPISLELMTDPVTISTGHTYDRSSITKWFKSGNPSCPKTGEKLKNTDLVPNLALLKLIQQHCNGNESCIQKSDSGHKNRNVRIMAGSLAAEGALRLLGIFFAGKLVAGSGPEKNKAAYEIRILTKVSIFNRSCLIEAGIIQHLLMLLLSTDLQIQANAMAGLLNLSKHSKGKISIVENGGLKLIIDVLKNGLKSEARQHAAAVLFYVASVEEYREMIGEIPEAIPALVELIKDGTDRSRKNALVAIFGLVMHHGNRLKVIAAGSVPLLINVLKSFDREDLITDCLAVLATLAERPEGTIAILGHKYLDQFVEIFCSLTSRTGQEYSVSLLLALCINGGVDVVAVLGKNSSLMAPLFSLLRDGTSRGRKKAAALIRILHEFCEKRSSSQSMIPPPPVVQQQRFVHIW